MELVEWKIQKFKLNAELNKTSLVDRESDCWSCIDKNIIPAQP